MKFYQVNSKFLKFNYLNIKLLNSFNLLLLLLFYYLLFIYFNFNKFKSTPKNSSVTVAKKKACLTKKQRNLTHEGNCFQFGVIENWKWICLTYLLELKRYKGDEINK